MTELDRWRLVLGRFSQERLGEPAPASTAARQQQALDHLYRRAYAGRGVYEPGSSSGDDADGGLPGDDTGGRGSGIGPGGSDPSAPHLSEWLGDVRELFPGDVSDVIVHHALERFGLTEVLADPRVLSEMTADEELLYQLLALRRSLPRRIDAQLRRIVAEVVDQIRARIEPEIRRVLTGARRSFGHSPIPVAANFDVRDTIRRNLKNYDPERARLVVEQLRFFDRTDRRLNWEIIICVDQSGSMAESTVHSAVMAAILAGLPGYRIKLIVFDTSVVDLSAHADDPITTLMTVQLGGGTNIGKAVRYAAGLVENPARTVLVLVTDFCEGGPPSELRRAVTELAAAGVRMIGLASFASSTSGRAVAYYDRQIADDLADCGMDIAALTPHQLAEWLTEVTS